MTPHVHGAPEVMVYGCDVVCVVVNDSTWMRAVKKKKKRTDLRGQPWYLVVGVSSVFGCVAKQSAWLATLMPLYWKGKLVISSLCTGVALLAYNW